MSASRNGPTNVRRNAQIWPKQPRIRPISAGQGPDIGTLAAFGLEHGLAVISMFYKG